MKPHEIAALLGVAPPTIRAWSTEFSKFLTPSAAGGNGRHRDYTELDLRILSVARNLRRSGTPSDEVHATLSALQANDWQGLPSLPEMASDTPLPMQSVAMVPAAAADALLDETRRSLTREVALLREQIEKLESRAMEDRGTIINLNRRLAEAEQLVRLYESGRLKPASE
jgi:DNA-binding transcriptional MerR regulator